MQTTLIAIALTAMLAAPAGAVTFSIRAGTGFGAGYGAIAMDVNQPIVCGDPDNDVLWGCFHGFGDLASANGYGYGYQGSSVSQTEYARPGAGFWLRPEAVVGLGGGLSLVGGLGYHHYSSLTVTLSDVGYSYPAGSGSSGYPLLMSGQRTHSISHTTIPLSLGAELSAKMKGFELFTGFGMTYVIPFSIDESVHDAGSRSRTGGSFGDFSESYNFTYTNTYEVASSLGWYGVIGASIPMTPGISLFASLRIDQASFRLTKYVSDADEQIAASYPGFPSYSYSNKGTTTIEFLEGLPAFNGLSSGSTTCSGSTCTSTYISPRSTYTSTTVSSSTRSDTSYNETIEVPPTTDIPGSSVALMVGITFRP